MSFCTRKFNNKKSSGVYIYLFRFKIIKTN